MSKLCVSNFTLYFIGKYYFCVYGKNMINIVENKPQRI